MLIGLVIGTQAQEISKNAIGLRFGTSSGFGTEISYQRRFSNINRLELNLGWVTNSDRNRFKLLGLYQWVWNIDKGFNWYAGAGAGAGFWKNNNSDNKSSSGILGVIAGNLGIEYNFDFPLQLSLDVRPEFAFDNDAITNSLNLDLALGIRYKF